MLALIVPLGDLGNLVPPGIWPSPGHPAHPIAPGGSPGHPAHPIALPPLPPGMPLPPGLGGTPEHPIYLPPGARQGPGFPTNPIAPGGPPPGGVMPPYPDQGLPWTPGHPAHPIAPGGSPGVPTHPIILPGTPEHPIAAPPGQVWPPITELRAKTVTLAWLPGYGYRWVVVEPPATATPKKA